ncbi:MAG TPA: hypothetical protein VGA29_01610 [Ignavibacteriaceae bacterium]|jgi:hypothetical protein
MNTKISDLTVDELKNLITKTVQETIEDYLEDLKALSSKDYINSIREAREDYKAGDYKDIELRFGA